MNTISYITEFYKKIQKFNEIESFKITVTITASGTQLWLASAFWFTVFAPILNFFWAIFLANVDYGKQLLVFSICMSTIVH